METWQLLLGVGAFMTPIVLAAMARDRALITMIKTTTDPIHDRINRVRDEYVREDHLNGHLSRIEKRFDDMANDVRRRSEQTDKRLDEITRMLRNAERDRSDEAP